MTTLDSVPIIDVEPLVRMKGVESMDDDPEVRDVVRQLDLACRHMGFFYVSGHGIRPELCQAVLDLGREFFSQSEPQKLRIGIECRLGFQAEDTRSWEKISRRVLLTSMRLLIISRSLNRKRHCRGRIILS